MALFTRKQSPFSECYNSLSEFRLHGRAYIVKILGGVLFCCCCCFGLYCTYAIL